MPRRRGSAWLGKVRHLPERLQEEVAWHVAVLRRRDARVVDSVHRRMRWHRASSCRHCDCRSGCCIDWRHCRCRSAVEQEADCRSDDDDSDDYDSDDYVYDYNDDYDPTYETVTFAVWTWRGCWCRVPWGRYFICRLCRATDCRCDEPLGPVGRKAGLNSIKKL